jgi:hypothetical protein
MGRLVVVLLHRGGLEAVISAAAVAALASSPVHFVRRAKTYFHRPRRAQIHQVRTSRIYDSSDSFFKALSDKSPFSLLYRCSRLCDFSYDPYDI